MRFFVKPGLFCAVAWVHTSHHDGDLAGLLPAQVVLSSVFWWCPHWSMGNCTESAGVKSMQRTYQQQRLLFLAANGSIKSTCTRKLIKEIHTNMSHTANVIDN